MNCEQINALLSAYHDGELEESRVAELQGHLALCDDCRRCAEDLSRMRAAFASARTCDVPTKLWDRVERGVQDVPAHPFPSVSWRPIKRWAPIAALLVIGLIIVYWQRPRPQVVTNELAGTGDSPTHSTGGGLMLASYLRDLADGHDPADRLQALATDAAQETQCCTLQPVLRLALPRGYELGNCYVAAISCGAMEMCFTRNSGRESDRVFVLQQSSRHPASFQGLETQIREIAGMSCRFTQASGFSVFNFSSGERNITIMLEAEPTDELMESLVASLAQ